MSLFMSLDFDKGRRERKTLEKEGMVPLKGFRGQSPYYPLLKYTQEAKDILLETENRYKDILSKMLVMDGTTKSQRQSKKEKK
ncbi:hypothetical protein ES703_98380 [subsurface metagenome]